LSRCLIIAEAGVNHNGDLELAKKMIDQAKDCGADIIKFQTFQAEKIASRFARKAVYQKKNTAEGSQLEMLKKLELNLAAHQELKKHCIMRNIEFLSTAFDLESLALLEKIGVSMHKIPSGEITNLLLLRKIASIGKPIIMSSGMANLGEIEAALDVLTAGGIDRELITVLHCTTEYPAPIEEVNLLAMLTVKEAFKIKTGYSDHTPGIEIAAAAAALGASVIEKHFTLDKNLPGPDHQASLEPPELENMIRSIRNIEKAMGSGIKIPSPSEIKNRDIARKSIVAACFIKKNEIFTAENLAVKRPGSGISSMLIDEVIGKKAPQDFSPDELIIL